MKTPPMMSSSAAVMVGQMFAAAYRITPPEALKTHEQFGNFSVVGNYGGLSLHTYQGRTSDLPLESRTASRPYALDLSRLASSDGPAEQVQPRSGISPPHLKLYDLLASTNYQPNAQYQ